MELIILALTLTRVVGDE